MRPTFIGHAFRRVESAGSTNADLARMALEDPELPDGFVLLADKQTAGKGRQGRSWSSPPGSGLTFSVLLKPGVTPLRASTLPLAAGLAVARAVEGLVPGGGVGLKWPNDLHAGGRKLCGILCEMRAEGDVVRHVIAGMGINVNLAAEEMPPEIAAVATSLQILAGRKFDRDEVLSAILLSFDETYGTWWSAGFPALLGEIGRYDIMRGRPVAVECGSRRIEGVAAGMADDGALLVRHADGSIEPVYSGDAHVSR